jgi:hypothetical protein
LAPWLCTTYRELLAVATAIAGWQHLVVAHAGSLVAGTWQLVGSWGSGGVLPKQPPLVVRHVLQQVLPWCILLAFP